MRIRFYLAIAALASCAAAAYPAGMDASYVSVSKCRICHLAQAKSWEQTRMAKAFDLLKPGVAADAKRSRKLDPARNYTRDTNCLACHVTGYGRPGGFESIEKTPSLAGVQCEACHGAGGNFVKPELMSLQNKEYKRATLLAAGLVPTSEKVCADCHNSQSPFYKPLDYAAAKDKAGIHQHIPLRYPH